MAIENQSSTFDYYFPYSEGLSLDPLVVASLYQLCQEDPATTCWIRKDVEELVDSYNSSGVVDYSLARNILMDLDCVDELIIRFAEGAAEVDVIFPNTAAFAGQRINRDGDLIDRKLHQPRQLR